MIVATLILVLGKNLYVHKPPQGSILTQVFGSIFVSCTILRIRTSIINGHFGSFKSKNGNMIYECKKHTFRGASHFFSYKTHTITVHNLTHVSLSCAFLMTFFVTFFSSQYASKKKLSSSEKPEHWLDHAKGKYSNQTIEDTKILLKILVMFIPLPIYWALFDQQVSHPVLYIDFLWFSAL